jgi:hypothetical protein
MISMSALVGLMKGRVMDDEDQKKFNYWLKFMDKLPEKQGQTITAEYFVIRKADPDMKTGSVLELAYGRHGFMPPITVVAPVMGEGALEYEEIMAAQAAYEGE